MLDMQWLLKTGACKKVPAGRRLLCASGSGHTDREMYILISGQVDVYSSAAPDGIPERVVCPGDVFGGCEFFYQANESVYIAHKDSVVYALTESSFRHLAQSQPNILFEVLKAAYAPPRESAAPAGPQEKTTGRDMTAGVEPSVAPEAPASRAPAVEVPANAVFPSGHKRYPGITKPGHAKLLYAKAYVCPCCQKTFEDYKVFQSKLYQSKPVRYDLRRYYSEFQTEWYDVITCPHCYFSTLYGYYSEPKSFNKAAIEKELAEARRTVTLDFSAERDIDYVFASHYLALLCAPGYSTNRRQLCARLWANLSWLYEDVEDEEMARFAAGRAAEAYKAMYGESRLSPVQEQATCLTIAGMLYRAGETNDLKKFLFIAKTSKHGNKVYADLADDLMETLRKEKQ